MGSRLKCSRVCILCLFQELKVVCWENKGPGKRNSDIHHILSRDGAAKLLIVIRFEKMKKSISICLSSAKVVNIARTSFMHSAKRSSVNMYRLKYDKNQCEMKSNLRCLAFR